MRETWDYVSSGDSQPQTNWNGEDFNGRGNFCECQRYEPVEGCGGMLPQKILKSVLSLKTPEANSWKLVIIFPSTLTKGGHEIRQKEHL